MKTSNLAGILALVCLSNANAALYTVRNGVGSSASGIEDSLGRTFRDGTVEGNAFPSGGGISAGPGSVSFGIFLLPDNQLSSLTPSELVSAFLPFGGAVSNFLPAGPTGVRSVFQVPSNGIVAGSQFDESPIYLIAGNKSSLLESDEFLVLRSITFIFQSEQDFIPTPLAVTLTTQNSTVVVGETVPNVQTTNTDMATTPGWRMQAVPEPSTVFFAFLGAIGVCRRRR